MSEDFLFVEKYRPKNIAECILPQHIKKVYNEYIEKKEIQHLLLSGQQGIGKTSSARALCNELETDVLFINGSEESGIDVLRTTIRDYASTVSLMGNKKVVIIDEADYLNCLEENETVRIGTLDDWKAVKLNELYPDKEYNVISFNMETGFFENDTGKIIKESFNTVFEITLDERIKLLVTIDHPFIVYDIDNTYSEISIKDGLLGKRVVIHDSNFKHIMYHSLMLVTDIKLYGTKRVINLQVNKNHTFVTGNGITVHNCNSTQPALRAFMEEFANTCKFILTCNYKNRILPAIHSRCNEINFNIPTEEVSILKATFLKKIVYILNRENITFDIKVIARLIEKFFPDFRKTLNELQKYSLSGYIDSGILTKNGAGNFDELFTHIKQKRYTEVRKWLNINPDIDHNNLRDYLFTELIESLVEQSIPQLVLHLAFYQKDALQVANQQINTLACITEIMRDCSFK